MIAKHDRLADTPACCTEATDLGAAREDRSRRSLAGLGKLTPLLRAHRWLAAGAVVSLTAAALISLALPTAVRRLIDRGFARTDGAFVDHYFLMLVVLAIALAVASACRYYFVAALGERLVCDLRLQVFQKVVRLPASFFDANRSGEVSSRLTADAAQIKSAVSLAASVALRNSILCVGALAMMFVTSPGLSSITVGAIPLIVVPLVVFGRSVRQKSRSAQDALAAASAFASEIVAGSRTIQAFNGEEAAQRKYVREIEASYASSVSAARSRAFLTAFAIALVFASVVGVLWIGAQNLLSGAMTAGDLGQFLLYAVIAAGSLGSLSEVWGELAQAAGAAGRLFELMDEEDGRPKAGATLPLRTPVAGRIEFEDVRFAYPGAPDRQVLRGLSMRVSPGETVAVVGASGSGKSTLFSVLLGFYGVGDGKIAIDGRDVATLSPEEVRQQMAIVPQDITIFASSIKENIAIGRPEAIPEEIEAAAARAQAHDFVSALPNGYDTVVGERGLTLSGGQRQRIAIARAVLKDAPILLLDEATSSLDAESEMLVQKGLDELMENRTTIVIAHRLATVLKADRILVMDEGRIVEEGTHSSLVRQGGAYARLAELQFDAPASLPVERNAA
ncbi:ATP-binding cassette domain-containing protein [Rhizobium leguminosarum bv. viciae]|uniref:ABC transporter transmembrane domain-containing protein n=1 Tax=Rhizobium leguminosarum TaxID=384 RepID=UPI001441FEAB|nr:ABC transporter transmembrane domain-containing protein [Rhizobium leguminosarum]NKL01331.1 ATP-binding cassette domain-containing protein [Rhizobium leguminosarum bv. viciae]